MAIYTKTGDDGTTALLSGQRVKKYALRVEAYGTIDELNAVISIAAKFVTADNHRQQLESIQHQLFYLSADVATEESQLTPAHYITIQSKHIEDLERLADHCMAQVAVVKGFVLLGQTKAASFLHQARTIARRAERCLVQLSEQALIRAELLKYINRLSDALYAMARAEDARHHWQRVIDEVSRRYQHAIKQLTYPTDPEKPNRGLSHYAGGLDSKRVDQLLSDALQAAQQLNVAVVIALVDGHGNLISTYRMPDALLISIDLAPKKAYSAVALKTATHQLTSAIQPGGELYQLEAAAAGKIVTLGGGYPLYINDQIVAGIGVSGGSIAQDRLIAEAAVNRFYGG